MVGVQFVRGTTAWYRCVLILEKHLLPPYRAAWKQTVRKTGKGGV